MHLGHIVAPQEESVGMIHVFVTAHGFVETEGGHKAGDCAGHAKASVGFEVVGADAAFHQFGGGVSVRDGPLARAVHRNGVFSVALDGFFDLLCDQVERFFDRNFDHLAIFADHRLFQAIFSVQGLDGVVAFDAQKPFVDGALWIAFDSDGTPFADTDQEAASCTTKAAGGFFPCDIAAMLAGGFFPRKGDARDQLGGCGERAPDGEVFEKFTSRDRHRFAPTLGGLRLARGSWRGTRGRGAAQDRYGQSRRFGGRVCRSPR